MTGQAGRSLRVLVVEDEALLALDLVAMLEDLGAEVVGPAYDLAAGLELAVDQPLDFALLDFNLGSRQSLPIAKKLQERDIPFVFLTGYAKEHLPDIPDADYLSKPTNLEQVRRALETATGTRDDG